MKRDERTEYAQQSNFIGYLCKVGGYQHRNTAGHDQKQRAYKNYGEIIAEFSA